MKRFFKVLSVAFLIPCISLFSLIAYGDINLPDEISITENETPEFGSVFSAESEYAVAAGTKSFSEYKSHITALKVIPIKEIKINVTKRRYVGLGGDVFGIKLYTKGIIVVSTDSVTTSSGSKEPAVKAGLKCGDIITHINGEAATSSNQLTESVEQSQGQTLKLSIDRNGEKLELTLRPEMSVNGGYKAGIWVRDSSAGIGTVTFYDDSAKPKDERKYVHTGKEDEHKYDEKRMAEDEELVERYEEDENDKSIEGNIYVGKVQNMQKKKKLLQLMKY